MADGTQLNVPTTQGDVISTDDITGGVADKQKVQRTKTGFGDDGAYNDVSLDDPLPISVIGATSADVARVTNGGLDINIQDQHTRALDLKFVRAIAIPTTLAADTVVDAHTVELTSAVGFVDGTHIIIAESGTKFYVGDQIGAPAGNVITLDSPMDRIYASGSAVIPASYDMAVDGSVTPVVFQVGSADSSTVIDITRVMGYMEDNAVMYDTLFGSIAALTNGCVLRLSNGEKTNIWNVKTNADLALLGYDLNYPTKVPSGTYSARFRVTYASQGKHGVTLRLAAGDTLEFIVQDDLTAISVFNLMAQGHIVE